MSMWVKTIQHKAVVAVIAVISVLSIAMVSPQTAYACGAGNCPQVSTGGGEDTPSPDGCKDANKPVPPPEEASVGDPINAMTGRYTDSEVDMVIIGLLPITFARLYDNQSKYDSPVGYGWAHNYDWRLYKYKDGSITVRKSCGYRERFVFTGGSYTPESGHFPSL